MVTTVGSVENNSAGSRRLGPRRASPAAALSKQRARILDLLRDQPEPLTQAAVVTATGLHPNTVREHLVALVRGGWVRRFTAEPEGRGRPAWLYELTEEPGANEYAGLATRLAGVLSRVEADPQRAAASAGREWGRQLIQDRAQASPPCTPAQARALVVEMMGDLRFDPVTDPADEATVRLTRCPLLEAAHQYPDVVCGVHLGIVRGALEEFDVSDDGSDLRPFAEPGACLLTIPPVG